MNRVSLCVLPFALLVSSCSDSTDPANLEHAGIFAGGKSACAITVDGELFCWGDNSRGQLATAGSQVFTPAPVPGNPEFTSVSVGTSTCAVGGTGGFCWGAGEFGNLGNGSTADRAVPQGVRGGLDFTVISTASAVSCGITADSTAYCWGRGERVGSEPPALPVGPWLTCVFGEICAVEPVPIASSRRFIAIAAGELHACGIDEDGAAWCWGYDFLGNGEAGGGIEPASYVPVAVAGGMAFSEIESGDDALTCALTTLGKAWCWGIVVTSAPPAGGEVGWQSLEPVAVGEDFTFADLAVGARHACGVTPGGTAWCWGANATGALGDGTTDHGITDGAFHPVVAGSGMQFRRIAAGVDFTCGLTFEGELFCWGANDRGQLGNGSLSASLVPTLVASP